jgi:hypothetical protein
MTNVSLCKAACGKTLELGMAAVASAAQDTSSHKSPDPLLDPNARLRIATRIHFALLRHYGEDVAVGMLLGSEADAREALWVCDASGDAELALLAQRFREAGREEARTAHQPLAAAKGSVPQDLAWSQDTSGFGVSRPLEIADAPAPEPAGLLSAARWLRRGTPR